MQKIVADFCWNPDISNNKCVPDLSRGKFPEEKVNPWASNAERTRLFCCHCKTIKEKKGPDERKFYD